MDTGLVSFQNHSLDFRENGIHDNNSVTETKSANEGLILNTALRHATIK